MRVLALFLCSLVALPLFGQSQLATLTGTVTDPSGAATPNAEIRLVNTETGERYGAVANASGNYTLPLVKPGSYGLTCEISGFKQRRESGVVLVSKPGLTYNLKSGPSARARRCRPRLLCLVRRAPRLAPLSRIEPSSTCP